MKSVLLHISDDEGQESRLIAALAVARQQAARLTCIQITPVSDYVVTDPFGGMHEVAMLFEHLAAQAVELRTRIEARLGQERVAWEWSVHDGGVAGTLVSRSRLADLIVLSQEGRTGRAGARQVPLVADVAIHARTPVLAVPVEGPAFDPGGVAMIAWNGSPESAYAVRVALPLLRLASAVHVITVDENERPPMDDIRRYLEDHGVTAECAQHGLNGNTVGFALGEAATEVAAAYIVMGAYGHSRLREAVLGGVSRRMLAESPVPLLLAH